MALTIISLFSLSKPIAALQGEHKMPLIFFVVWQWSIHNLSWELHIAHLLSCLFISSLNWHFVSLYWDSLLDADEHLRHMSLIPHLFV
jgi:hypothetical protein